MDIARGGGEHILPSIRVLHKRNKEIVRLLLYKRKDALAACEGKKKKRTNQNIPGGGVWTGFL